MLAWILHNQYLAQDDVLVRLLDLHVNDIDFPVTRSVTVNDGVPVSCGIPSGLRRHSSSAYSPNSISILCECAKFRTAISDRYLIWLSLGFIVIMIQIVSYAGGASKQKLARKPLVPSETDLELMLYQREIPFETGINIWERYTHWHNIKQWLHWFCKRIIASILRHAAEWRFAR